MTQTAQEGALPILSSPSVAVRVRVSDARITSYYDAQDQSHLIRRRSGYIPRPTRPRRESAAGGISAPVVPGAAPGRGVDSVVLLNVWGIHWKEVGAPSKGRIWPVTIHQAADAARDGAWVACAEGKRGAYWWGRRGGGGSGWSVRVWKGTTGERKMCTIGGAGGSFTAWSGGMRAPGRTVRRS